MRPNGRSAVAVLLVAAGFAAASCDSSESDDSASKERAKSRASVGETSVGESGDDPGPDPIAPGSPLANMEEIDRGELAVERVCPGEVQSRGNGPTRATCDACPAWTTGSSDDDVTLTFHGTVGAGDAILGIVDIQGCEPARTRGGDGAALLEWNSDDDAWRIRNYTAGPDLDDCERLQFRSGSALRTILLCRPGRTGQGVTTERIESYAFGADEWVAQTLAVSYDNAGAIQAETCTRVDASTPELVGRTPAPPGGESAPVVIRVRRKSRPRGGDGECPDLESVDWETSRQLRYRWHDSQLEYVPGSGPNDSLKTVAEWVHRDDLGVRTVHEYQGLAGSE